jgi:hypothetical protein
MAWGGLALLLLIWVSTAVFQVPAHEKLKSGFDEAWHRRLVDWNWVRTGLWTLRAMLLLWIASGLFSSK